MGRGNKSQEDKKPTSTLAEKLEAAPDPSAPQPPSGAEEGVEALDDESGGTESPSTEMATHGDEESAEPEAPKVTLDELRELSYILAESADRDGYIDVVTKGGAKLRFPGDEEKAAQLTLSALNGQSAEAPQVGPGGVLPKRTLKDLRAITTKAGLSVVMAEREEREEKDGDMPGRGTGKKTGRTFVTTRGGVSIVFPDDEAKAGQLTDSQLDGEARKAWPRLHDDRTLLGKPIPKA